MLQSAYTGLKSEYTSKIQLVMPKKPRDPFKGTTADYIWQPKNYTQTPEMIVDVYIKKVDIRGDVILRFTEDM